MSKTRTDQEIKKLAESIASHIKTEEDLGELTRQIRKATIEAAPGVEMEAHLGYPKTFANGPPQRQQPQWLHQPSLISVTHNIRMGIAA